MKIHPIINKIINVLRLKEVNTTSLSNNANRLTLSYLGMSNHTGIYPHSNNGTLQAPAYEIIRFRNPVSALQPIHKSHFQQKTHKVKTIHIAIFGIGNVGGTLIDQVLASIVDIEEKKHIRLKIFAIANSSRLLLDKNGMDTDWYEKFNSEGRPYEVQNVVDFARFHHLDNLIAIDNTASAQFVQNYLQLVQQGFHLISSNKIGNTMSFDFYQELRHILKKHHRDYLYETNVGAGLPLIDTIKLLHLSGEKITAIKGAFSGSLSYLFNTYSISDRPFSSILAAAVDHGYTEPDPREDLSGNDVARKLLILARELDLKSELSEINILNLIPEAMRPLSTIEFMHHIEEVNFHFKKQKDELLPGEVLRYIGEITGDIQNGKSQLKTDLVKVSASSPLGQLSGSDSLFEIYTESYGTNPIIIRGAGAGAAVTARGVFGDILRIATK